jgi:hypothetical protein
MMSEYTPTISRNVQREDGSFGPEKVSFERVGHFIKTVKLAELVAQTLGELGGTVSKFEVTFEEKVPTLRVSCLVTNKKPREELEAGWKRLCAALDAS